MRKIILLLTLLFAGVIGEAYAQGIRFHEGSFDEALVRAKQEKKLIFIDFYTEWCGPCKWMSMNVFNRSDVGDFFNKNFVCCKIDAEKEGKELAIKYKVQAYPTLLFLDSKGEVISKAIGKLESLQLIESGKTAISGDKTYNYSNLEKEYQQRKHDPEFLKHYIEQMSKTGKRLYEAVENYLKVQTEMEESSVEMMEFLMKYKKDLLLGGKVEEVFTENYDEYMDIATRLEEGVLVDMMYRMYSATRGIATNTKNVELFKRVIQFAHNLPEEYMVNFEDLRLDLLIVEDNIKEYRKEAVNYIDSMILCKTIDEVHECDKAFHARRCHEIDSTGEGGMYKEMYKEVYRDFEANRQINAIIKEGNRLLNGAKKKDYKNIWRWIDYGKKLLPTNCAIRNFEATVLYRQGKKEEAIALKKGILVSKDLDNRRLKYIIEEELKSMEQGTF